MAARLAALAAVVSLAACGGGPPPAAVGQGGTRGIPAALPREARPIGAGRRFRPPVTGPVLGRCRHRLGARIAVHVELFAANRVVIVAAGIGTRAPRVLSAGRITSAGCYGDVVTLEPTGVVLVRTAARARLASLFRSWGEPLSSRRLAAFSPARHERVTVYVDGRRWRGQPGEVPLAAHSEIVLEVGPHVPPHRSYTFPPAGALRAGERRP